MREEIFIYHRMGLIEWTYQDLLHPRLLNWEEPLSAPAWTFEEGAKEVIGYRCKKATVDFRGRHYTAWYAPDIPLPYGPWSFHGLPGLILEIKDDTDRVSFVAHDFNEVKRLNCRPLVRYKARYNKTSREKARRLIEFMHKHPYIHAGDLAKRISGKGWGPKLEWMHTWVELE